MATRNVRSRSVPCLALAGVLAVVAACGGGGGGDGAEPDSRAPSGLSYDTNPVEYVRGEVGAPNYAHVTGGDPVTGFAVSPALPAGLTLDVNTGAITGTPTATSTQTTYTITASNGYGSTTVGLKLSVRKPAGFLISGSVFGMSPGVSVVKVIRTADNTPLGQATVRTTNTANVINEIGVWSVEGATPGTYRIDIASDLSAQTQGKFRYYPASRTVTVASSDVSGQDFCIGASTAKATVCRVTLSTYTPKIGGDPVTFTADLVNWGTSSIYSEIKQVIHSDVNDTHYIPVACGTTAGQLPPGACTMSSSFSVPAYWSPYPGDHPVHFDLISSTAYLDYFEMTVNLTP